MSDHAHPELDTARRVAATYDPAVPPGARERVWQRVERHHTRPLLQRITWLQAGLVAACAAVLWFARLPDAPVLPEPWVTVTAGAALDVPRAQIAALSASTVRTPAATKTRTVVQVVDGALSFDVEPQPFGRHFEVETRHAIVRVVGTRFDVEADDDGTRVRVHEGIVEVTPRGGDPVRLTPGTTLDVAPARMAAAPIAKASRIDAPKAADAAPEPPTTPPRVRRKVPPTKNLAPIRAQPVQVPKPPAVVTPEPGGHEKLQTARRILKSDSHRAVALATEVLDADPSPELRVDALAVLADARRRSGELEEAARLYAELAEHLDASAYAEEALLRLALVLRDLGRGREGEAALDRAHRSHPNGPLAMERAALAARLALADGDPRRAASALDRAPDGGVSIELLRARVDVAELLLRADRDAAARVIESVNVETAPADLKPRISKIKNLVEE